ncbi:MAG: replicative DNA helicase, partial [Candidatus Curtissbacteria bacterium]|nr:replicative DNA helicase [Candidatus Curtissbacteria bacterium]
VKRQLIATASKVADAAFEETGDIRAILDETEQTVFGLSQQQLQQNFSPLRDALAESFDRLDELHKKAGGLRGVPTGFWDLDGKLAGMQDSNLLILASRPGQGKTSMALNIAQHVAVHEGLPVGIFSLEMSREELVDRLLVTQSDVDAWKLKTGNLDDSDFDRLQEAMGILADAPLFIDDTPASNILEMRTKARRLQVEHGLSFLVVDYLQLIHGRNLENRVQEVSEISQSLKNLARELKIPILACSQLSRAVEQRGSRRPQLADLRESGAIEQDADVVMFIYRPDPDKGEEVILDIQKHRNGPTGEINLMFKAERVKFYGVEKRRARQEPVAPIVETP